MPPSPSTLLYCTQCTRTGSVWGRAQEKECVQQTRFFRSIFVAVGEGLFARRGRRELAQVFRELLKEREREKGINQISAKCQPPSAAQGKNTSVTQEDFPEREEQGIDKVDRRRHTCEILLHLLFILLHCPKV